MAEDEADGKIIAEIEKALDAERFAKARDLAARGLKRHPRSGRLWGLMGETLAALGETVAAADAFREACGLLPESPDHAESLADASFRAGRWREAEAAARRALALDPESVTALDILAYLAERDGRIEEADRMLARARAADPEVPFPARMDPESFRERVAEAIERLPGEFRKALDENLSITVEPVPPARLIGDTDPPLDPAILGFYAGVPLLDRGGSSPPPLFPDAIFLFQRNIEHVCGSSEELVEEIATTLYHEIAHFLGFEEDEMEGLGLE